MIGQQNAIDRLFEQQAARQEGHDIEQEHHLLAAVDDELYNQALVNLLTAHSLPHSLVEWPEWYAMLHTVNYMAPGVVTQSRGQVPKLLEASFITHREKLRSKLKSSLTQVHFSIDIWSSPNHHSLLGIVAHFIDRECRQLRKALLALRELEGAHSGEAIAETFLTVIDSYGLHGQVGYFTLDNAYNNDTMLQAIAKACDFDTAHRRLRCNGHIINLAVQAFLFGRNKDASDEALRQVSQLSKDEQEGVADRRDTATAWRRHGALGMLHNLVVWVRSSGQRYQAFSKAAGRMIPQDNSTRWNSWYLMIHVAIKARKEVNSFIDDHYTEGDISLDYLHPEHWQELQEIHDFLQPFHEITKDTQWDNSSLDEVICSMDFLITHYKASTEKFRHSLTMTDRIMTSWYKFDDYYRRTDDSPVYAAAILLHPSLRRAHLHEAWKDQSQYIGPAVEAVRKLWEDYKPRQVPTINEDLSAYEAYKQQVINEGLPRAAWSTIAARPAGPARLSLAYALLLAQMFLGFTLAIVLVSTSQSFTDIFVPEFARARSISYVRISSFSTFSSAVEAAIAAASRALDQPDVPLLLSSVKFAVNIVLDLLLISTFHVRTEDPTVEMQAGIQLTCNMAAALLSVLYFVFKNASCRQDPGITTENIASHFAALKILVRPGLITFAESAVRNVLYLWLVSTIVALGSTYATAWGVFNTIRWGLVMVPVSALEASTLAFCTVLNPAHCIVSPAIL
ncbi:hypothetical protein O9K51_10864 [Purpureocillium lavendulum]|uniref:Uncharacterized protein n=1 Tax=Purpureocillium lavendulum TaxID=1247861 RepID=A0AB34FB93_9HYPO|nr:hypothetical protein O9K51_10864 [Purpureocillium lavendulum]